MAELGAAVAGPPGPSRRLRAIPRESWSPKLLLIAALVVVLPPWIATALLVVLAVTWGRLAGSGRVPRLGRLALGVAAALMGTAALLPLLPPPSLAQIADMAGKSYASAWEELRIRAQQVAAALPPPIDDQRRLQAFAYLESLAEARGAQDGLTFILLDANGESVAWAGDGLLHEPSTDELPARGVDYRVGYTALSIYAVEPVAGGPRPWRLVAGRSIIAERVPEMLGGALAGDARGWRLAMPGAPRAADEIELTAPGSPSLFLTLEPRRSRLPAVERSARRLAKGLVGLLLLVWALHRAAVSLAVGATDRSLLWAAGVAAAGAAVLAMGADLSPVVAGLAAVGAGLGVAGLAAPVHRGSAPAGGLAVLGLLAGSLTVLVVSDRQDLAAGFAGEPSQVAMRVGLAAAAIGLLALAGGRSRGGSESRRAGGGAWLAVGLLAAAAGAHDVSWVGVPLLVVAGGAAARWSHRTAAARRPGKLAVLILLAAGLSATAWEVAFRLVLRHDLERFYLPRLAPPADDELAGLRARLATYFDRLPLDRVPSPSNPAVDPQDLAFTLWRRSPLAELDGLSALAIELPDGRLSRFSFGLSINAEMVLDPDAARWMVPQVRPWLSAITAGRGTLVRDGEQLARLRYWWIPRPGFRLDASEVDELDVELVRSRSARGTIDGLPAGVSYALYGPSGRALVSPWRAAPPLSPTIAARSSGAVETPSGRSRYWLRRAEDGFEVLYLPMLGPREALERVGTHAFAASSVLAALALVAWLLAMPAHFLREELARTVRSYSKRLILVFTLLLLLPLVALNLVLLRELEGRLRAEQVRAGQGALDASRLFLVDFLEKLQPGFGIDTAIDSELLEWIARVVQHDVNLYWGSTVYTSSRQELFTAGLLPRRIPGEVFSRLALLGYELGSRTQQAGELAYGEIYAPLKLPGVPFGAEGLFLSVPLLEQEEDVLRELATLQRRAILVSTVLFLLLIALGSRLARSFTEPIEELVAGTRRIAGGADRLGTQPPRELELAALAAAIDSMARRIAEARRRLLGEKEVVERIVANITSGVVSLDGTGRVLLSNRVAGALLGVRPGERLEGRLAVQPMLAPVMAFLSAVERDPIQRTVELVDGEGSVREWTLTWVPIAVSDEPAALLVIDDATEVLRGQRLTAWAEMARMIAHEIKNPLTPIQLSTEHLRRVHETGDVDFDEVFERCTRNILQQVDELREIASEFSTYSRIPRADLQWGNLTAAVEDLVAAYRDAAGRGVEIALPVAAPPLFVRFDERLLGRALRNLLENALRATGSSGRVEVEVAEVDDEAVVTVRDSGPGVAPEHLGRIFDPYFSTHDSGTGLGLAIARRVVEEHGGRIEAHNRQEAGGRIEGLELRIILPRATADA